MNDLKDREKKANVSEQDREASVIVHKSTLRYYVQFKSRRAILLWQQERIIWIGFFNNVNNAKCLISKLPKDIVRAIIRCLRGL